MLAKDDVEEMAMDQEAVNRLSRDLREAAKHLSAREARYLVDSYYQMQDNRKRAKNQIRHMAEDAEPHAVIDWLSANSLFMEQQVKAALDYYGRHEPVAIWARSIKGIGPVIAAGLSAHIDIEKAPTVGHIWNFAGLNPDAEWKKGERRPWNADLKTLCWKIGESFVKVSGYDDAFYGKLYLERKAMEIAKNDAGDYADQAKAKLERFKIGKTTDAYKHYIEGHLPPAHIHARAKRYAVKLFLSHWHQVAYQIRYHEAPPKPYSVEFLGHAHVIPVPNEYLINHRGR